MSYPVLPELKPGTQIVLRFDRWCIVGVVGYVDDYAVYAEAGLWSDEQVAANGDKIAQELAEQLLPMFKAAGLSYRP